MAPSSVTLLRLMSRKYFLSVFLPITRVRRRPNSCSLDEGAERVHRSRGATCAFQRRHERRADHPRDGRIADHSAEARSQGPGPPRISRSAVCVGWRTTSSSFGRSTWCTCAAPSAATRDRLGSLVATSRKRSASSRPAPIVGTRDKRPLPALAVAADDPSRPWELRRRFCTTGCTEVEPPCRKITATSGPPLTPVAKITRNSFWSAICHSPRDTSSTEWSVRACQRRPSSPPSPASCSTD